MTTLRDVCESFGADRFWCLSPQHGASVNAMDLWQFTPEDINKKMTTLRDVCDSFGDDWFWCLSPQHGASVNAMDLWQFTPLHEAASKNRVDVCSLLLAHGADPTLVNCHAKSAVDVAPTRELQDRLQCEWCHLPAAAGTAAGRAAVRS